MLHNPLYTKYPMFSPGKVYCYRVLDSPRSIRLRLSRVKPTHFMLEILVFVLQQHGLHRTSLEQDIPPQEIDQALPPPRRMPPRRNPKHLIQLLQRLAFRLRDEEQHPQEANNVPRCVPGERARGAEGREQRGEGHREDEVEEPGRRRS